MFSQLDYFNLLVNLHPLNKNLCITVNMYRVSAQFCSLHQVICFTKDSFHSVNYFLHKGEFAPIPVCTQKRIPHTHDSLHPVTNQGPSHVFQQTKDFLHSATCFLRPRKVCTRWLYLKIFCLNHTPQGLDILRPRKLLTKLPSFPLL